MARKSAVARGRRPGQISRTPLTVSCRATSIARLDKDAGTAQISGVLYTDSKGNRLSTDLTLKVSKNGKLVCTVGEAVMDSENEAVTA